MALLAGPLPSKPPPPTESMEGKPRGTLPAWLSLISAVRLHTPWPWPLPCGDTASLSHHNPQRQWTCLSASPFPTLSRGKLRLMEGKGCAQGPKEHTCHGSGSLPGLWAPRAVKPTTSPLRGAESDMGNLQVTCAPQPTSYGRGGPPAGCRQVWAPKAFNEKRRGRQVGLGDGSWVKPRAGG